MKPRTLYLGLCVAGTVLPLAQFVPFLMEHGLDPRLFVEQLFASPVSGFFGMDVIVSSLVLWVLARSDVALSVSEVHAFHVFMFATGGVGHVAGAGLLVAGVSVSAGLPRFLPRWLMVFGLVVAASGYENGVEVTPVMQNTIWVGFTIVPAVSCLISAVVFGFYRLDRRPQREGGAG